MKIRSPNYAERFVFSLERHLQLLEKLAGTMKNSKEKRFLQSNILSMQGLIILALEEIADPTPANHMGDSSSQNICIDENEA